MICVVGGWHGIKLGRRVRHGDIVIRLIIGKWYEFELFCGLVVYYISIPRVDAQGRKRTYRS